jgi:hypothetical protein
MTTPEVPITTARWLEIMKPELEEFAERDIQQQMWFGGHSEISSPTELICTLLDTYSFEDAVQEPDLELSEAQRTACLKFAQMVRGYARGHQGRFNEHEVIDDPDWEKIRVAAKELIKILYA